jgi:hypothetical protein
VPPQHLAAAFLFALQQRIIFAARRGNWLDRHFRGGAPLLAKSARGLRAMGRSGEEVATMNKAPKSAEELRRLANAVRALAMDGVEAAKSGHPGMPMGMADVATLLFSRYFNFDSSAPHWPDRDRFVLSAGHGSMLLYALLHLTGYADMTLDELKRFRQLGSKTPGHPE